MITRVVTPPKRKVFGLCATVSFVASMFLGLVRPAQAETRLQLDNGKVALTHLYQAVRKELRLKHFDRFAAPKGEIEFRAFGSEGLVGTFNLILGDACK